MKKILFVCLGNICRSPCAEGIFKDLVAKKGESQNFAIDSAGTGGWHAGELPDPRMRKHAKQRGIDLNSRARQFDPNNDFDKFDLILPMDQSNFDDIVALDSANNFSHKVKKMADFCRHHTENDVPDPYYQGPEGFEKVLDILEDACDGLYQSLDAPR